MPYLLFIYYHKLKSSLRITSGWMIFHKILFQPFTFSSISSFNVIVNNNKTNILTSTDEKNDPDIIPHDNSDDEKDFERLYTPTQLNYVNRHSPNSHSPTLRFNEKQVSWNVLKGKIIAWGCFENVGKLKNTNLKILLQFKCWWTV